jgi:hypothetical protein
MFDIDWLAARDAEWRSRVRRIRETGEDMQGCISSSVALDGGELEQSRRCENSSGEAQGFASSSTEGGAGDVMAGAAPPGGPPLNDSGVRASAADSPNLVEARS